MKVVDPPDPMLKPPAREELTTADAMTPLSRTCSPFSTVKDQDGDP